MTSSASRVSGSAGSFQKAWGNASKTTSCVASAQEGALQQCSAAEEHVAATGDEEYFGQTMQIAEEDRKLWIVEPERPCRVVAAVWGWKIEMSGQTIEGEKRHGIGGASWDRCHAIARTQLRFARVAYYDPGDESSRAAGYGETELPISEKQTQSVCAAGRVQ